MKRPEVLAPSSAALLLAFIPTAFSQETPGAVVINEIMFDARGDDAGREWVELFNTSGTPVGIAGWTMANRAGRSIATLPDWQLPAKSYLTVHFGEGKNDGDFQDGSGAFYTGGAGDVFDNSSDEVALYRAAPATTTIVDFLPYAFLVDYQPGAAHGHAIGAKIWTEGSVFQNGAFVDEGSSLGRDANATDTNTPGDWSGGGGRYGIGVTPSAANDHPLSYHLGVGLADVWLAPLAVGQVAEHPAHIQTFLDALKQIRTQKSHLLRGLPDQGMGAGEPQVQQNGDILLGRIRFRFGRNLTKEDEKKVDRPAGGLTFVPGHHQNNSRRDGETLILIDVNKNAPLWKMKDTLIHELVHSGLFNDRFGGYWVDDRNGGVELVDDETQKRVLRLHETLCYLTNLRLLLSIRDEFPDDAEAINERIEFKAKEMLNFFSDVFRYLKSLETLEEQTRAKGREFQPVADDIARIRERLTELLRQRRDLFVRTLVVGQAANGQLSDEELTRIWNLVQRLNELMPPAQRLTLVQFRDMSLRFLLIELLADGRITEEEWKLVKQQVDRFNGKTPCAQDVTMETVRQLADRLRQELAQQQNEQNQQARAGGDQQAQADAVRQAAEAVARQAAEAAKAAAEAIKKAKQEEYDKLKAARTNAKKAWDHAKKFVKTLEDSGVKRADNPKLYQQAEDRAAAAEKAFKDADKAVTEFKLQNDEHLSHVESGERDMRLARASFVDPENFTTPLGRQANAGVEYFSRNGNLDGLEEWIICFSTPDEWLHPTENTPLVNEELDLAFSIGNLVDATVNELTDDMKERQQQVAAAEDPQAVVDLLRQPAEQTTAVPENLQDYVDPVDFRTLVFDRFASTVAADIVASETSDSGDPVLKGSAVVDDESDEEVVGASVTFFFEEKKPEGEAGETQNKTVRTDENGKYQVELPPGSKVITVKIGGEDLSTVQPPDGFVELDSVDWFREAYEQPDVTERIRLGDTTRLVYQLGRQRFSGQDSTGGDIPPENKETVQQFMEGVILTQAIMGAAMHREDWRTVVEDGLRVGQSPQEIAERLAAFGWVPPVEIISGDGNQVRTERKLPQVTAEIEGSADQEIVDTVQSQIADAIRKTVGPDAKVIVEPSGREELNLPVAAGGKSSVLTWTVRVDDANGAPVKMDDAALGENLDQVAQSNPRVRFAEPGRPSKGKVQTPNDPHFGKTGSWQQKYHDQWAVRRVGFTELSDPDASAWSEQAIDGWPSIVAVIGSGVDWTHPELLGQMWVNMGETPDNGIDDDDNGYVDDHFGWNFRDNNPDVMDRGGHDTHIAGVIAARWNNNRGIAGVNPRAKIMALKVANYLAQSNSIDISRAIFYAVDNGARVINISYGGESLTQIEQRAIDYARSRGALVVVAAGNESDNAAQHGPAGNRGAVTVAGLTVENSRARFSNWGQPVDLAAPTMDILGLRARGTDFLLYVGENPDYDAGTGVVGDAKDLYRASGTSFAAPLVSGTASLIWSLRPELTAEQVRRMLVMTADDVEITGWDQYTGTGRLNARKALQADPDHYLYARISGVKPVRRGGKVQIQVEGQAVGSEFEGRWLQVGFGESPGREDWKTVAFSKQEVDNDVLGLIPPDQFDRKGKWTIRLLARDGRKVVKGARATLDVQ